MPLQRHSNTLTVSVGAIAAAALLALGSCSSTSIIRAALAVMLALAAAHDVETRRIENGTVLAFVALRVYELLLHALRDPAAAAAEAAGSLIGVAFVLVVLLATALLMARASGQAGIGGGDVKLLAALGFCLGAEAGLMIIALSSLIAVVHRARSSAPFAFAPYIAIAAALVLFSMPAAW